ncbi:subtilisin-like protease SBT4.3 [Miscanthus floridulus]|uniref:subtilisin-like protease SBT4.3 n=1 Tax=Miscanthus floridulus TaxID=154761 RepID=UPI00345A9CD2
MPRARTLLLLLLVVTVFATSLSASESIGDGSQQVYIVYLGHLPASMDASEPEGFSAVEFAHHDLLNQVLDDGSSASDRILRSYKRSLNGFAAKLSKEEADKLSGMNGVVSVFLSRTLDLLTTRSWDFLGFPQTPIEELPLEGDVIIGMLDTGIWPDSPSFSDEGFGPPPSKWKGTCHNFTCNNKIIGARAYDGGSSSSGQSPLDDDGHGSHTASTAAGRAVANVSLFGLANGTARGAVPGARLAIYKVCCGEADILAGFDDAIADGVDVISISIGNPFAFEYFSDVIAIGSFHAMRRGVLTSASAGNSGLEGFTVCNVAPWLLSVAASSIDRRFIDKIVLGNGKTIVGASINTFPTLTNVTLAFPTNGSCDLTNLEGGSYTGKVVLCQKAEENDGSGPLLAGAAGAIIVSDIPDVAFALPLPGLTVTQDEFDQIMAYVNSTSNPVGTLDHTEITVNQQAPVAASFSSPGPNLITPDILKPDLSAPGVDIIASWSLLSSPTGLPDDKRKVQYNIISGTSMACPHASGAAAYVKSFHRDWSPAMIMSALITTAAPMDTLGNSNTSALKYGAGQLNPAKAHDPGLVYDASESDYVAMLCAQGYNATQLALITGCNATACSNSSTSSSPRDLNYPTMAARVEPGKNFTVVFPRTVTNVGAASAVYDLRFEFPDEAANVLTAEVSPNELEFSEQNQKVSFTVTVSGVVLEEGQVYSFTVVWYNNEHKVSSSVVVYTMSQ